VPCGCPIHDAPFAAWVGYHAAAGRSAAAGGTINLLSSAPAHHPHPHKPSPHHAKPLALRAVARRPRRTLPEQSRRRLPQRLPDYSPLAHRTPPRMDIAPIRPILRSATFATHLVDDLPSKRRRWKSRPSHRLLPILIHKPRHGCPSIHLPPTTNAALRFATISSKFHPPKLPNLPVYSRRVRARTTRSNPPYAQ
jgi:hypothetical protein